ncbi:DUF2303 family protein [Methylopila sp. M107]|uniref:DUF2303 family protein n=1 Tax=Methylopila sp. M107 TaxID=1101190 RepID=UPI00037BB9C1|nr:DUF2303 family protein [Methylopila sp. M107]
MAHRTELPDDLPKTASAVEAIAKLAKLAQDAQQAQMLKIPTAGLGAGLPAEIPSLYEPRAQRLVSLRSTIEEFRLDPRAREGKATVLTLASFIDLLDRHKDEDSAIFAETRWPSPKITGVVDYHRLDHAPRHGRHTIVYEFPITEEMKAWQALNGKPMGQGEFAAFLEEHAAELSAPFDGERSEYEGLFKERFGTPSEIIALSRDLEVFVGSRVKRQERLSSGERTIEFVEEHSNASGEKITIPGIFMVSVPAFVDGVPVRIPARLRYRLAGGDIKWFYQLYRWEFWLREQVQKDLDQAGKETGLPTFEGVPEQVFRGG